jgi:hypothetical protein
MAFSTGKNFDNTLSLLLASNEAQLVSRKPSQYKRKDLPDSISDKLERCDIPHVEKTNENIYIYFSCCSEHDVVLGLEVISRFPDLIEKQVYDLLLPNKSVA